MYWPISTVGISGPITEVFHCVPSQTSWTLLIVLCSIGAMYEPIAWAHISGVALCFSKWTCAWWFIAWATRWWLDSYGASSTLNALWPITFCFHDWVAKIIGATLLVGCSIDTMEESITVVVVRKVTFFLARSWTTVNKFACLHHSSNTGILIISI